MDEYFIIHEKSHLRACTHQFIYKKRKEKKKERKLVLFISNLMNIKRTYILQNQFAEAI